MEELERRTGTDELESETRSSRGEDDLGFLASDSCFDLNVDEVPLRFPASGILCDAHDDGLFVVAFAPVMEVLSICYGGDPSRDGGGDQGRREGDRGR